MYRVFRSFTMETILATAFGRQVELQRGETDSISKSMEMLVGGFTSGQVEKFILLESKFSFCITYAPTPPPLRLLPPDDNCYPIVSSSDPTLKRRKGSGTHRALSGAHRMQQVM
jgi:hypothetical protein